jgi:hypothetical protein
MWRSCFLRELAALNIGVDDILLGNELSSPWNDPSFPGARELGSALALEGGDRAALEKKVTRLIADKALDDYNRLAMHYLFLDYICFLPVGTERSEAFTKLKRADETLPGYLSARVSGEKEAEISHAALPSW